MNRLLLVVIYTLFFSFSLRAQSDSFDVFLYTPPEFFTRSILPSQARFTLTNSDKSYCSITLYKSQYATDSIIHDVIRLWNELVVKRLRKASSKPLRILTEQLRDGWVSTLTIGNYYAGEKKSVVMLNSFRKNNTNACVVYAFTDKLFKGPIETFSQNLHVINPEK
jgi:hypothetical protein